LTCGPATLTTYTHFGKTAQFESRTLGDGIVRHAVPHTPAAGDFETASPFTAAWSVVLEAIRAAVRN
jgi:hypothetical protein